MKLPARRLCCALTIVVSLVLPEGGCTSATGKKATSAPFKSAPADAKSKSADGKKAMKNTFPDAAEVGLDMRAKEK